jgi:hypothetical protein
MGGLRGSRRQRRLRRPAGIGAAIAGLGHNGGPPLDDHIPAWGPGGVGTYFAWRAASAAAFGKLPAATAIRRARKAEELGLTFREYQLEILERGRFLQREDAARIAEIVAARPASAA